MPYSTDEFAWTRQQAILYNSIIGGVNAVLRWRVTFRPRIVNIIISYDEGGAHDTTRYMVMVKIEFRIFAQNF